MREKMQPTVSIGMPVYNGAKYIKEALDSLLAQTYSDFELIISDNASTDTTQDICEEYAKKDKRIRYIRQENNIGPLLNFQYVLDESVGEYFMWAAHDDMKDNKFLEICLNVLKENQEVGLVFSYTIIKNLQNQQVSFSKTGFNTFRNKLLKYLFRLSNSNPSMIYGLFRKNVLKNFSIELFDYFDVHLTHWFELNSSIAIIPLFLYTAGTDGVRIPYSVTGKSISIKKFISHEYEIMKSHFSLPVRGMMILITWLVYTRNMKKINRKINEK